jgi:hypothetical protein
MTGDLLLETMTDKRQTRPLVREGTPERQYRDCQTVINIWSWAPAGAPHQNWLTDWLTVSRIMTLTLNSVQSRVEAESNNPIVALRVVGGDEKGSLESGTLTYGRESNGTQIRERLLCRGPAVIVNDTSVLSSERALHINKPATVWQ